MFQISVKCSSFHWIIEKFTGFSEAGTGLQSLGKQAATFQSAGRGRQLAHVAERVETFWATNELCRGLKKELECQSRQEASRYLCSQESFRVPVSVSRGP